MVYIIYMVVSSQKKYSIRCGSVCVTKIEKMMSFQDDKNELWRKEVEFIWKARKINDYFNPWCDVDDNDGETPSTVALRFF